MGAQPGRAGWSVPAAALTTLVLVQALRVWFPSVLFVVGDAGSTSALTMGAFALSCLLLGPLVAILTRRRATLTWQVGAVLLAVAHAAFLFTDGGMAQAATSSLAVVGGTMALTAVAAVAQPGVLARTGVVFGLAGEITIHAAFGTHTLAWRGGLPATIASLGLVLALVAAVRAAARDVEQRAPLLVAGHAWPWLALAPLLLLTLVIAGSPGRIAVATGWPPPAVASTVVGGQALAVIAAVLAPRLAPLPKAALAGGLVLVGTTGSLQVSGVSSALAQLALPAGLALVAVSEASPRISASALRRAVGAAAGLFGFGVLTFVYYAGYDIRLGFYNRAVLIAAAVAAAALAAGSLRPRPGATLRPSVDRGQLLRLATGLAIIVFASGIVRTGEPAPAPSPGEPDVPLRLVLYNLHMGFDIDGRFAVPELAAVIRDQDPDIVVLNEVDRGWLTTGGHDVLQLLLDELDDFHAVFAPGADEVWGNALLTRFPVTELSKGRLPRGNDPMHRGQLAAVLEVAPDQQLGIVGTHLTHIDDQGATRLPQARAVAATVAWFHERGLPTAVLGDLNAGPDSAEIQTFRSFVGPTLEPGNPTWPSWDPDVQIDHVLVSPQLQVVSADVVDTQASDHLPIVVTVRIGAP